MSSAELSNLELLKDNTLPALGSLFFTNAVVPAAQHTVGEVDTGLLLVVCHCVLDTVTRAVTGHSTLR